MLYTTSVKAVRSTHEQCKQLVHILRSHRILFTNKDVFLHPDYGRELAERMGASKDTSLPQVPGSYTCSQVFKLSKRLPIL